LQLGALQDLHVSADRAIGSCKFWRAARGGRGRRRPPATFICQVSRRPSRETLIKYRAVRPSDFGPGRRR
jgi:hypothetical protein